MFNSLDYYVQFKVFIHTLLLIQAIHRRQVLMIFVFYPPFPRMTLIYICFFKHFEWFLPFSKYYSPPNESVLSKEDAYYEDEKESLNNDTTILTDDQVIKHNHVLCTSIKIQSAFSGNVTKAIFLY